MNTNRNSATRAALRPDLAGRLLEFPVGSRLPTVREWAGEMARSVGSVQQELARLQADGAVAIDQHGKLGMFMRARSVGALWAAAADGDPMVAAMPLPSTRRLEGLATGIKHCLQVSSIDAYFLFVRGSRRRMEALRRGRCHIAVMSVLAARELCTPSEEIALELPLGSFVSGHAVFTVPGRRRRPRRVIVDSDSIDQRRLCEAQFAGESIEVVPAPYMQFSQLLAAGAADATVWSIDEMADRRPEGIRQAPLSAEACAVADDTDTRACLVIRRSDNTTLATLTEALDPAEVSAFQESVMNGTLVPEY